MNTSWLTLTSVQVARETAPTNDGMGGVATVTTTMTTLARAALFQAGSARGMVSDKVAASSTHVLVCNGDEYTWNERDRYVVYSGDTYRVVGRPDDVAHLGRMSVVSLELIE